MPSSHGSPRAAEGLLGVLVRAKRLIFTETKMDAWAAVWGLTQSAQKVSEASEVGVARRTSGACASRAKDGRPRRERRETGGRPLPAEDWA